MYKLILCFFVLSCGLTKKISDYVDNSQSPKSTFEYSYLKIDPSQNGNISTQLGLIDSSKTVNPILKIRLEKFQENVISAVVSLSSDPQGVYYLYASKRKLKENDIDWLNFSKDFKFHGVFHQEAFIASEYPRFTELSKEYVSNEARTRDKLKKVYTLTSPASDYYYQLALNRKFPELKLRINEQNAYETDVDEKVEYSGPNYTYAPAACLVNKTYGLYRKNYGHSPSFNAFFDSVISDVQGKYALEYNSFNPVQSMMTDYSYVALRSPEWKELKEKLKFNETSRINKVAKLMKEFEKLNKSIKLVKENSEYRHPASVYRKMEGTSEDKFRLFAYLLEDQGFDVKYADWNDKKYLVVENALDQRISGYSNKFMIFSNLNSNEFSVEPLMDEIGATPYYVCPPIPRGKVEKINLSDFIYLE